MAQRRVRLLDSGAGEKVVVVLHGWGGRIESMGPAISCLVPRFRVLALDLPGFGHSPRPEEPWGTPEYAAFVQALLSERDITRAHFLGHSFGAKIALLLAATQPQIVDKCVVVGSPGLRSAPSVKVRVKRMMSRIARAAGKMGSPGRALRQMLYGRLASNDYREAGEMRPILVRVVNEDISDLLPRVKAPTLLIWGSRDDAVPISHARRIETLIPDAGLVVFEGAGHFAYLDEPERFCRVARHFLTSGAM